MSTYKLQLTTTSSIRCQFRFFLFKGQHERSWMNDGEPEHLPAVVFATKRPGQVPSFINDCVSVTVLACSVFIMSGVSLQCKRSPAIIALRDYANMAKGPLPICMRGKI